MPSYKVNVKWGKEHYPNIVLNTDLEAELFKVQLYTLTGVPPGRQKIMVKGCSLKDDSNWDQLKLSDGVTVLLVGSREEDIPKEPVKPNLNIDDDTIVQNSGVAKDLPPGLSNLGNTCYLNATVQCLRSIPELAKSLTLFKGGVTYNSGGGSRSIVPCQSLTASLRDLWEMLDKKNTRPVPPIMLLQVLQMVFPRFAEKDPSPSNGFFRQQDASECWAELIRLIHDKLPALKKDGAAVKYKTFVDQFMGGVFDVEYKSDESTDMTKKEESFLQLNCFISQEVKFMITGLHMSMKEHVQKFSADLNRDATFTKTSKIRRLPAYLTVQFMRFYYKEKEHINAKVLKDVRFPILFDAYDLCSDKLKTDLLPMREKYREEEQRYAIWLSENKPRPGENPKKTPQFESEDFQTWFEDDYGSNNSGFYSLRAVLTHKGRSSSTGHYVAWVRHQTQPGMWVKLDDEVISPCYPEDIIKLSGGGDWHVAYLLLYGPRIMELSTESI